MFSINVMSVALIYCIVSDIFKTPSLINIQDLCQTVYKSLVLYVWWYSQQHEKGARETQSSNLPSHGACLILG